MGAKFSIVTASFNCGRYIRDCLNSVKAQQGATWEHIVVDGGSTDDTAAILREYPYLKVVCEPDDGISDGINKGFNLATGEWVMWLNADDRLKPGALREAAEFAARCPAADIIYGTFDFIDGEGRHIRRMHLLPYSQFIHVHHGCYVPSTATFLRRATVLDEGFRLDKRFRVVMDEEFYARLAAKGKKWAYFPVVLADFRWHQKNHSVKTLQGKRDMDSEWKAALHAAEGWAVARTYGFTPFKRRAFTYGSDFCLYLLAWAMKGVVKLPYWLLVREPQPLPPSASSPA